MATTPPTTIDARPKPVDLQLYAGDDVTLEVTVTDNATPPAPIDLTGYTALAQLRGTADAAISVDFDATITTNVISLTLAGADTTAMPAKGVWDCQVTSATGAVTTLCAGKVTVTAEVSR